MCWGEKDGLHADDVTLAKVTYELLKPVSN